MHKYFIPFFLSLSSLTACEFIAGVTVPEEYQHVEVLLAQAALQNTNNTETLKLLEEMETHFLVLLAGRNDRTGDWKNAIERLVISIKGLTPLK